MNEGGAVLLRNIQLGPEVSPGTAVASTAKWRGMGVLEDMREIVTPEEHIGLLGRVARGVTTHELGKIDFQETPLSFEQFLYFLEASMKTVAPVQDGAGSDYISVYPVPTTSKPTIKTYTIEGGDDKQAREMEYSFAKSWKISGKSKGLMMMSSSWIGRTTAPTTFTPALSIPAVEAIPFGWFKLYIDDVGTGFGNTQLDADLFGFELEYNSGFEERFAANGTLKYSHINISELSMSLKMTLEHNANSISEIADFEEAKPRAIRLIAEGSDVVTPGTTYSKKTLIIDLPGIYRKMGPLGDDNKNSILDPEFDIGYDSTLASQGQITVVHELSAVP